MSSAWTLLLVFVACFGFGLSLYIRQKKITRKKIKCPFNANCSAVIYSNFSKFFGIPIEIIGQLYFGIIAILYSLFFFFPALITPGIVFGVLAASTAALFFSGYLVFVQLVVIKDWCSWCIGAAFACLGVFLLTFAATSPNLALLFNKYRSLIVTGHLIGAALGLGGATMADIFFFKFLKNFRISNWQASVMNTLSQIIWLAVALLVISGLGLYFTDVIKYSQSVKFLIKMLIVGVITVNGALLYILVSPELVKISFHEKPNHKKNGLRKTRRIAFALGSISISSWYLAFILGTLSSVPTTFGQSLAIYLIILALAITTSQLMEHYFTKQAQKKP